MNPKVEEVIFRFAKVLFPKPMLSLIDFARSRVSGFTRWVLKKYTSLSIADATLVSTNCGFSSKSSSQ